MASDIADPAAAARPVGGLLSDSSTPEAPQPRTSLRQQIGGFLIVGAICTAASLAIFTALRPLAGTQWANLIALVLTSVLNTELNRRHSWSIRDRRHWFADQSKGLWVMFLALLLTSSSLLLLHTVNPRSTVMDEVLTITAANVLAALTRFLLLRYWIFRRVRR
ncbi:GtrA family protein [Arthrobacter russicus]|uniref:Flippase GtrA n=1 Tax=Arthrobacter russicus TaxID=172040 RepID=A0ABU1JAB2_9MICC|nr:GtrA family protein [Arthrobacter russicus]MDN5667997.1 GtrA family protein [Renibacterium salmoninarum]MDR6268337.1 putative flippase GtrA [Arthrobacter russicus]